MGLVLQNAADVRAGPEPVWRVPLSADREGNFFVPTVQISGSGGVVVVEQLRASDGWLDVAEWYSPDAALVAMAGAAAWLIRSIRRVMRRPQVRGRMYCRKCNYEVRDAGAGVCPECGSVVGERRSVRGRSGLRRLAASGLTFLMVVGVGASVFASMLERPTPRLGGLTPQLWPLPIVSSLLPALACEKRSPTWGKSSVRMWELPSGKRRGGEIQVSERDYPSGLLAPAGEWYVVGDAMRHGELKVIDLVSGTVHRAVPREAFGARTSAVAFSPDGSSVLVEVHDHARVQEEKPLVGRSELWRLTLPSFTYERVAEVEIPLVLDEYGRVTANGGYFAAMEAVTGAEWALWSPGGFTGSGAASRLSGSFALPRGEEVVKVPVDVAAQSHYRPRISNDGSKVLLPLWRAGRAGKDVIELNMATGAVTERGDVDGPGSARSAGGVVVANENSSERDGLRVSKPDASEILFIPITGTLGPPHAVGISENGEWVAAVIVNAPSVGWWNELGIGTSQSGELVVWNISELVQGER